MSYCIGDIIDLPMSCGIKLKFSARAGMPILGRACNLMSLSWVKTSFSEIYMLLGFELHYVLEQYYSYTALQLQKIWNLEHKLEKFCVSMVWPDLKVACNVCSHAQMWTGCSYTGEPQSYIEDMQSEGYKTLHFGNSFYKLSNMYTYSNGIYNEVQSYFKILLETNEHIFRISDFTKKIFKDRE